MVKWGVILGVILITTVAQAGVAINGTRVILSEGEVQSTLSLKNNDNKSYLIQAWLASAKGNDSVPFAISPEISRLDTQKNQHIKIYKKETALPEDRESLFIINIKMLPALEKGMKNYLIVATQQVMKLIYRPKGLAQPNFNQFSHLITVKKGQHGVELINLSPYVLSLSGLKINKKPLEGFHTIHPYDALSLPETVSGQVSFRLIDDYGSKSRLYVMPLS